MSANHKQEMTSFSSADYRFMALAIKLAKQGHYTTSPNPRVGCVLVYQGKIIGQGFHKKAGSGHAEVNALAEARKNNPELIKGATAYVTLEPCSHFGRTPPCAKALIDAQVGHVIAAMVDPNPQVSGRGLAMLEAAGISTQYGLLEKDAQTLNIGFIKRMKTNMPYVRCKLAASLDGKTAMANGESKWITSPQARQDVQRIRAQSCAIISGADSILTDNAKMNVRWEELGHLQKEYCESDLRQPVRVVIDSQNRLTPNLAFFKQSSAIILVRGLTNPPLEKSHDWPHFVKQIVISQNSTESGTSKVNLSQLLAQLAEHGINEVLLESGAHLAGAFIEQNLVDELILYQAPKLMGGEAKNLVEMPSIQTLVQAKELIINDVRMLGNDIKITANFKS